MIEVIQADANNSGVIEFEEFLKAIEKQKKAAEESRDVHATLDAFVALGGNVYDTATERDTLKGVCVCIGGQDGEDFVGSSA